MEINSNNLLQYSVEHMTLEVLKKITKQMKHCICKIKNEEKIGTGFFCNINLDKKFKCHALITSYDMFKDDDINKNKSLKIYLNDDNEFKSIQLNNNRK